MMATFTECARPIMGTFVRGAVVQAARKVGVEPAEYLARRDAGERWCTQHRRWHPPTVPFVGNTSICKAGWSDYTRSLRQRKERAS